MRISASITLPFLAAGALAASAQTPSAAKAPIVVENAGFATPEAVEYSAADDHYLVANINGDPSAADNNGFISKLSPDGKVVALKWIESGKNGALLNAPKGMTIVKGHLYVADIDTVRVFDAATGKPVRSIAIKGATFLNGVAAASTGDAVYVTDSGFNPGFTPSGSDAIYKIGADFSATKIAGDKDMGHPNGVFDDGGTVVYVTFGSGKVAKLDAAGKSAMLPGPTQGQLDGLVKTGDGRWLTSSWAGKAVYAIGKDGKVSALPGSYDAPADLGLDTKRNRVLIPLFQQNKVVFLPL